MNIHPEIEGLVNRFGQHELHAAHSGRELIRALESLVSDSQADSCKAVVDELYAAVDFMLPNMPAYAPPINVLHKVLSVAERALAGGHRAADLKLSMASLKAEYLAWSNRARAQIAAQVFDLIPQNADLLTFTLSETVLASLENLWEQGKRFRVFVTESRPNNDGLTTAKRLAQIGTPVTVSIDSCLPAMIESCQLILSGAEAVLCDGGAICKAGTYLAALAARERGVPLYILADTMKFDVSSMYGIQHPLDPLSRSDFPEISQDVTIEIAGHLFDKTPGTLIHAIVSEQGVLAPESCNHVMRSMETSSELLRRLRDRA